MIIKHQSEGRRETLESLFARILTSTETPRVIRVTGTAQTERDGLRITELEVLNQKRLTKIRRLREGIRSLQACHERDQREILNLRQKLAEAGLKITRLERLGLDDDDE